MPPALGQGGTWSRAMVTRTSYSRGYGLFFVQPVRAWAPTPVAVILPPVGIVGRNHHRQSVASQVLVGKSSRCSARVWPSNQSSLGISLFLSQGGRPFQRLCAFLRSLCVPLPLSFRADRSAAGIAGPIQGSVRALFACRSCFRRRRLSAFPSRSRGRSGRMARAVCQFARASRGRPRSSSILAFRSR